jgi:hypothetical protein
VSTGFNRPGEQRKFASAVIRRLAAGLIVVGLAVGIWALWPDDDSSPSPTTTPTAAETTTTAPITSTTTSTTIGSTSTAPTHVVATVEEAEEILRTLWFGWFEGIYNQDEARIREVVGTQAMLDAARAQFGVMEFSAPPSPQALSVEQLEILRADDGCLAVWVSGAAPFIAAQNNSVMSVEVMRWSGEEWVLVSTWRDRNDLWEADCEGELQPLS